jgi:hypothetical protein
MVAPQQHTECGMVRLEKECFKCKTVKPLTEFYKHSEMADGHLNKCKECAKRDVGEHRQNNLEKIRAYDKQRSTLPHRVQARRDYANSIAGREVGRLSKRRYENNEIRREAIKIAKIKYANSEIGKQNKKLSTDKYHARYPLVYLAHVIFRNAIRDGKVARVGNCSFCGSTKNIQGHHDDYTKPLDVRWLCALCHKRWHKHNKPIYE